MRRKQRTVETLNGLPAELVAGPEPAWWTPQELPANHVGRPADQHERSAAYSAWCSAGDDWNAAQGLPARHWHTLLPSEVAYLTTALGREHMVAGGLGPPWQRYPAG